jgi:hypothetical protein
MNNDILMWITSLVNDCHYKKDVWNGNRGFVFHQTQNQALKDLFQL